jgi:hypothetical protein
MTQRIPPKIGQLRKIFKKKKKKRKQVNMRLKVVFCFCFLFLFFTFFFVDVARVRNIPHGQVDTQRHLLHGTCLCLNQQLR